MKPQWKAWIPRVLVAGFVVVMLVVGLLATQAQTTYNQMLRDLPSISQLRQWRPAETTRIFSRDGKLIGTLFHENRTWVPLKQVSPHFKNAVVAIEDSRFYEHRGVDLRAIARAAYSNYLGGGVREGASTLTMQLARGLFLKPEVSMKRKLREAILARQIERQLTKEEILELYVNHSYFGAGAYGIGAASSYYFNKRPGQLTLAESALLAGLLQSPSAFSPVENLNAARKRQTIVLNRMRELGVINARQYRNAMSQAHAMVIQPNRRSASRPVLKYPYFTTYVIHELAQRYDDRLLYRGGLKIYTTLDTRLQARAEELVKSRLAGEGSYYNADAAALVCVENQTGGIRAMVGGAGWSEKDQFNRAWQAQRHAGSAFKTFVYATALDQGYSPNDVVSDTKVTFDLGWGHTWSPQNADGAFRGNMPLWLALRDSRNVVSARLVHAVGPKAVIRMARRFGLDSPMEPHLSIALGAVEVTPLEMARAYSVLPNDGLRVEPTCIKMIVDSDGRMVEDNRIPRGYPALRSETARTLMDMLRNVVVSGTATAAQIPGRDVAGKTGTTDNHKDVWFVGFSPEYTTAVWFGRDDNQPMWGAFGGSLAAPLWGDFMQVALQDHPARLLATPAYRMRQALRLCAESHMRAGPNCPDAYRASFDRNQAPAICSLHDKAKPAQVAVKTYTNRKQSAASKEVESITYEQAREVVSEAPIMVKEQKDGTTLYTNTDPALYDQQSVPTAAPEPQPEPPAATPDEAYEEAIPGEMGQVVIAPEEIEIEQYEVTSALVDEED